MISFANLDVHHSHGHLESLLAFQVLGSVGGQAGQHIVLQQQVKQIKKVKSGKYTDIYLQQAAAGQSQPQIIQTTDGQTLIYQPVQVENQGQPQQASHYHSKICINWLQTVWAIQT